MPETDAAPTYTQLVREHLLSEHNFVAADFGDHSDADLEELHRAEHRMAMAEHKHDDRDDLDPNYVHCPDCGCLDLEVAEAVPCQVAARLKVAPNEPGGIEIVYAGDTRMVWDGSQANVDVLGRLELWCRSCSRRPFYDDRVRQQGWKAESIAPTLAGGYLRASVGQWLEAWRNASQASQEAVNELEALLLNYDLAVTRGQPPRIIVQVDGGVAEVVAKPVGVEVVIVNCDPDSDYQVRLGGAIADDALAASDKVLALIAEAEADEELPL